MTAAGQTFVVNAAQGMNGQVIVDGNAVPLGDWAQQHGANFPMPERGRVRVDCGETVILMSATPRPRVLAVPQFIWNWGEQIYTVGAAVAAVLFLLMVFAIPENAKSLSVDFFNSDDKFAEFLIKPEEEKEEEIPEFLQNAGKGKQGGKGKAHKGDTGKMGKDTSKNKKGLYALRGPKDNPDPRLAKKLSEEQARTAGILGIMASNQGSHLASVFGAESALGSDAENVLGGLVGTTVGEAYGVGGLGLVGTGSGGGGTGEGTIGSGRLGTVGKGGGGGDGAGYGRPSEVWVRVAASSLNSSRAVPRSGAPSTSPSSAGSSART